MVASDSASLLIRADAGGCLGIGHVMRMIALGQAWQDCGGHVVFAAVSCSDSLMRRIESEQMRFLRLGDHALGGQEDLTSTLKVAQACSASWIALDGYHFDSTFQQAARANNFKLLVVDDYGHCARWAANVVLNQNLHAPELRDAYVSGQSQVRYLLGPRFALLRKEFWNASPPPGCYGDSSARILVTFGGVDPVAASLQVLKALDKAASEPCEIRVIASSLNPLVDDLRRSARSCRHRTEIRVDVVDMVSEYCWANCLIGAGGSSTYEWLLFGLPAWVVSIAPNQDPIVAALRDMELACLAGRWEDVADPAALVGSLRHWLGARRPPRARPVDGHGAERVAAVLAGSAVCLWPVIPGDSADARFLFELANDPIVRGAGFHPDPIPWDRHLSWLRHHCEASESRLFLIELPEEGQAGLLRFHQREPGTWEVGISIHRMHRCRKLAGKALDIGMRQLEAEGLVKRWLARIRHGNDASMRLFEAHGFEILTYEDGHTVWIRMPPNPAL